MNGGDPGSRGVNSLTIGNNENHDLRTISLGGKNTVNVVPGNILTILTPGGGGFGPHKSGETGTWRVQGSSDMSEKSAVVHVKSGGSLNQYQLNQESV